jgi:hypothetical protein
MSHVIPRWVLALIQFFPLSLFATYAFWDGAPTDQRWIEAFKLAALAGAVQLAVVLPQPYPVNRLVLAGNLYLIFGGVAAMAEQWWFLRIYDSLRESAIFLFMLAVGMVATFASRAGFVAVSDGDASRIRWSSLVLVLATALCFFPATLFEGQRMWSAVFPIVILAVLQRFLAVWSRRPAGGEAG